MFICSSYKIKKESPCKRLWWFLTYWSVVPSLHHSFWLVTMKGLDLTWVKGQTSKVFKAGYFQHNLRVIQSHGWYDPGYIPQDACLHSKPEVLDWSWNWKKQEGTLGRIHPEKHMRVHLHLFSWWKDSSDHDLCMMMKHIIFCCFQQQKYFQKMKPYPKISFIEAWTCIQWFSFFKIPPPCTQKCKNEIDWWCNVKKHKRWSHTPKYLSLRLELASNGFHSSRYPLLAHKNAKMKLIDDVI